MRYTVYPRTLIFLLHGNDVLLIKRSSRARLFPGQYNGLGGHVERGEDVLSAAHRELREESGLEVSDLALRAIVHLDEAPHQPTTMPGALVFVFVGHTQQRYVRSSAEGELVWMPVHQLPEHEAAPNLKHLLHAVLNLPADQAPLFLIG